jgi:PadR family transcriptional regulator, regulatory protein PadR
MTAIDTKVALLSALVSGEGYGLEIIDRVRELTNGEIKLVQGRVYPALRELEAEGFLESYEGEPLPERGGRPRRYYRITAEGRRTARQQAKALSGLLKPVLGTL